MADPRTERSRQGTAGHGVTDSDRRGLVLPVGTVTFLVARLDPAGNGGPPTRCADLVDPVAAGRGGTHVAAQGDTGDAEAAAVFRSAVDAVAAALDLQRAAHRSPAPGAPRPGPRLRIGLHTGELHVPADRLDQATGFRLAAQLRDAAPGGRTLLSAVTASIVADELPAGAWLAESGAVRPPGPPGPERVFELRHPDLPGDAAPGPRPEPPGNVLPAQLSSFVGRDDELATVTALAGRARLVTLTGSGGCGKTRLAARAAAALADRWPDGVWWVDLGPVTDPSRVAELVASSIRVMVEPAAGPLRALAVQLRDRRMLVCLDNCEHLLDAAAELADALLRSCPGVAVLATSREPLGVAGETVWRVPSMIEDEAVALFAERAAQVRPDHEIAAGERDVVRTICRRLDGIPLAIELAAARAATLTPAQIAAELNDRFRLLSDAPRPAVARQQTLSASVDWSHDLLDPLEQVVFRRLAVFPGGFAVGAAENVCAGDPVGRGEVLPALRRLVDKSLLVADHTGDEARYRFLETIRHYAQDRLGEAGETAAARDRHLDHFLALAEAAEPELEDTNQDRWLARLETEHDNVRAALDWGLSAPDPRRGRRLAAALHRFWVAHGHARDGVRFLERALAAAPDDRSTLQTRLLVGTAFVSSSGARFDLTLDAAQRGLDLAAANGDDRHQARCLAMLSLINLHIDFEAARSLCLDVRRHAEAADDALAMDMSLVQEGFALTNGDRHEDAAPILASAVERSRRRGVRVLTTFALTGQVFGAAFTGDLRLARRLAAEAAQVAEPLRDYVTVGSAISNLAFVHAMAGDLDQAWQLMDPVVRSLEDDDAVDAPIMAVSLGKLHLWDGDLPGAVRWLARAARYADPFVDNVVAARALPGLASAYRRLGDRDAAREHADRAVALARRLDVPHALAEALDETAVLVAADDPDQAERLHHEALAIRVRYRLRTFYPDSLDQLARHLAGSGRHLEATRLHAAADAARARIGCPRPPVDRAGHDGAMAALRAALGDGPFDRAWSEGTALSLDDAVTYATRARGPRGRPSTGWDSLTPTERDVVDLAALGLTNPQIGARLLMARNTVKTHLKHIYAKLGVTNRTELATLASARPDRPDITSP